MTATRPAPSTEYLRGLLDAANICEAEICTCCWTDEAEAAAEHLADSIRALARQHEEQSLAAPQVPAMATSGVGAAEVDSRNDDALEPATSVHVPIASPTGAVTIQAHSKSEYKRLSAQGAPVLPPAATTHANAAQGFAPPEPEPEKPEPLLPDIPLEVPNAAPDKLTVRVPDEVEIAAVNGVALETPVPLKKGETFSIMDGKIIKNAAPGIGWEEVPASGTFRGWTFETCENDLDNPPSSNELTKLWGKLRDREGRFISHVGTDHVNALLRTAPSGCAVVPRELDEEFAKAICAVHTLDEDDWSFAQEAWEHLIAEADKRAAAPSGAKGGGI